MEMPSDALGASVALCVQPERWPCEEVLRASPGSAL